MKKAGEILGTVLLAAIIMILRCSHISEQIGDGG